MSLVSVHTLQTLLDTQQIDTLAPLEQQLIAHEDTYTVWALVAEAPEQRWLLHTDESELSSQWHPDIPSVLASAKGMLLCHAHALGGIEDGVCLLYTRSVDVSLAVQSMAEQLGARYLDRNFSLRSLQTSSPLEALQQVQGLITSHTTTKVRARVEKEFGKMGHEVVAKRSELDEQRALHNFYNEYEAACSLLIDAWEDPSWSPPPVFRDSD